MMGIVQEVCLGGSEVEGRLQLAAVSVKGERVVLWPPAAAPASSASCSREMVCSAQRSNFARNFGVTVPAGFQSRQGIANVHEAT